MRNWFQENYIRLFFSMGSGALLTLAFPNFDQGWLAWIALVPLLLAVRETRWQTSFCLGLAAGLVHYLSLVYWTAHTMHTYGRLPWLQSVALLLLLSAFLSLFPAVYTALLTFFKSAPLPMLAVSSMAWTALEYVRTWLFTGFPWELLGYSQYDHLWVVQFADIFGVYGVSALVVCVNTTLALLMLHWLGKPWQGCSITRRCAIASTAVVILALGVVVSYGILKIGRVDRALSQAKRASVAVVQGNIDQANKWDTRFQTLTTFKYNRLSTAAAAEPLDLIIWPETATPFFFLDNKILSGLVLEGVRSVGTHFIIGSPSYANAQSKTIYYNSAYLIDPQGNPQGRYDKVHLVPFGEYVPIKRWLPFIDKLVEQVGDFKPGKTGNTLKWRSHSIGMQICYEVIFPGLSRKMVQNGADILVNITNDAWFGRSGAPYQHFSMAVLRSVENRRFLVRAANTGISGFIDPCGRILAATLLDQEASAAQSIALLSMRSLYSRWGDWPLAILSFGFSAILLIRKLKAKRNIPFSGGNQR
jgi:apolipoprotein N-acyltransferase